MKSILYVGMDVHNDQFTLCTYRMNDERVKFQHVVEPDYKQVLLYLEHVRKQTLGWNNEVEFVCGYEAGFLGYSLYRKLTECHVNCVILAPSTIWKPKGKVRVKTDKRDAKDIARSLAYGTFRPVYIPDEQDNSIKEYIRMRGDHRKALVTLKHQVTSYTARLGLRCAATNWSDQHVAWLRKLRLEPMLQEALDEYLITYSNLQDKIERMDRRIEELAELPRYQKDVKKLMCFLGVRAHTALTVIVEISDFHRFARAEKFAAYLGLVPGEFSSGDKQKRLGITKAGNSHVRRLLIQSANSIGKGKIGYISKTLKARQRGNDPADIAYANRANERLRRKYYRLTARKTVTNVAKVAIARELACFIWGMMTGNIA